MAKKEGLWGIIKGMFKFVFVVFIAFFESVTVSFFENVKKRYKKPRNDYVDVDVPKGYKDNKAGPEYQEISPEGGFSDFGGLPGFK